MSMKRLLVLTISLCVVVVVVTVSALILFSSDRDGGDSRPGKSPPKGDFEPDAPPYAYFTDQELVVMRGDREAARIDRVFSEGDPFQNDIVWTHDGGYVVLLENVGSSIGTDGNRVGTKEENLLAVNTRTGAVERLPCPHCIDLAPTRGNSVIVEVADPSHAVPDFLTVDLRDMQRSRIPATIVASYHDLLVSTSRHILVEDSGSLELVEPDATPSHFIGAFATSDYILAAAAEDTVYGGERMAISFAIEPGACITDFPIFLMDTSPKSPKQLSLGHGITKTDMSAAAPPTFSPDVSDGLRVHDLWWGEDGKLRATIESRTCGNGFGWESGSVHQLPTLWRLDGNKWVLDDDAPAKMMRYLGEGARVALVTPCETGQRESEDVHCISGNLYLYEGGERSLIEKGVISVSTPPSVNPRSG